MMPLAISNFANASVHRQTAYDPCFHIGLLSIHCFCHYCSYLPIARLISLLVVVAGSVYRTTVYGQTRTNEGYGIYNARLVSEPSQCHASL